MINFGLLALVLCLSVSGNLRAKPKPKFILFTLEKSRVKSRIVLPTTTFKFDKQPNLFATIDGNPLMKIWIEKDMVKRKPDTAGDQKKLSPNEKTK